MGDFNELALLDATAQADLVRRKEIKAIELVESAIARIERLNPTLNAVVTPMYEQARIAANGELANGPFTGVPFLLKDLVASYSGVRKTSGSTFLRGYIPQHDSELVARLKRAGLIIIGKTNTPEFGALPTTEPHLFGPCHNPWDIGRTPGGSSGGSAAAVAARLVPMAHANDGGGSIRIPASCCGLFGLKPTRSRNPLGPDFGEFWGGLVVEHAITRSVRDSAALLDATCGPDLGDPYWAPPLRGPFLKEVGADPRQLRIAFSASAPTGVPIHSDCLSAVKDVAALCAEMGHAVVEAAPAFDGKSLSRAFFKVFLVGIASEIEYMARVTGNPPTPDQLEPLTWALYQKAGENSGSDYVLALQTLHRISRDIGRFFLHYDVWITPTLAELPVPLGTFDSSLENPMEGMRRVARFTPFTQICNITGQPAMSVPLSWNSEGLPVGTQFIGRFGDEATLFRLAAQLETARPWADRRAPVSA